MWILDSSKLDGLGDLRRKARRDEFLLDSDRVHWLERSRDTESQWWWSTFQVGRSGFFEATTFRQVHSIGIGRKECQSSTSSFTGRDAKRASSLATQNERRLVRLRDVVDVAPFAARSEGIVAVGVGRAIDPYLNLFRSVFFL
jgi:hypothetical protein